ncbi:hypothetical protein BPNPMPFG_000398 [Mesorhizobium sp. AR07]|uniref:hypothetical protein n=1 Tax=Mesorhizobium sp. AR07 TaxID=2865838 RepID=UPI002160EA92|nr:hypothetical protein [Mesorhizobium sp. AR07]UVK44923.1 hypothetical protein BPNPMPFG_000398 [Mesorhizobium sp. AR07]
MPTYLVEEIELNKVTAVHTVDAHSPFRAAAFAVGAEVTVRVWERNWIRVTDENRGRIYAFSLAFSPLKSDRLSSDAKRSGAASS